MGETMANEGGVAAVERALTILDAFRESDQSLTLTEISKRVGFYKSTTLRLAESLEKFGYLRRLEDGAFRLVADVLAALAGKGRVQGGRLGVGDRVADHGVAVSHVKTSAGGGPNSSNQRPAMARWSTSTTRFTSSTGTWPGAELCSPTAKLTDEPKTQPHSRLTAP